MTSALHYLTRIGESFFQSQMERTANRIRIGARLLKGFQRG